MAKLNIRNRNKDKIGKDGKPKAANWEYRFEAASIEGKRKQISKAGFRTKHDAEVAGNKAMSEYNASGTSFNPSDMSFSDYLDFWIESYVNVSCKYQTQQNYKRIIENHIKPELGHFRLKSLTPIALQDFVNHKYATGLKRNSLSQIVGTITGSLSYAVIPAQLIQSSPADHLKLPKATKDRCTQEKKIISEDSMEKILERFPVGNPFRYAILIGYHAGLRIAEVYGLTWNDVDFNEKTITVNKIVYKRNDVDGGHWFFGTPKTFASNRTIKIGDTLINELKEYRKIQLENRMEYGSLYTMIYQNKEMDEKGSELIQLVEVQKSIPVSLPEAKMIFVKENGQYSSPDSFKYAARIIHYDLGIDFTFHSLRHTHATILIQSGVSPKAVQDRLGHERIETTLQTYVHNTEAMEDSAVDAFEKHVSTKIVDKKQKKA